MSISLDSITEFWWDNRMLVDTILLEPVMITSISGNKSYGTIDIDTDLI